MESESGIGTMSALNRSVTMPNDREGGDPASTMDPTSWVDQYGDYLYAFAMSRLMDRHAAEDVVQETFVSALRSMKNF